MEHSKTLEDGCLKKYSEFIEVNDPANSEEPMIQLEFTYFSYEGLKEIKVDSLISETVIKNEHVYTEYDMCLARRDGLIWNVRFRYSELRDIRSKLIKMFKEIKQIRFPSKTIFQIRKLDEKVIAERKTKIENFINIVVKGKYHNMCEEFNRFLKVPDCSV